MIHSALNESGAILLKLGYPSFASLVLDLVSNTEKSHRASKLVEKLTQNFPAFNDTAIYKGKTLKIHKKAQLLALELYRIFRLRNDAFDFGDINELTVMSDNVLPAVLRKFGILKFSKSLEEHIDSGLPLPPGEEEVELRLMAVHACELILQSAKLKNLGWNSGDLDYYLWNKGKDEKNGFRTIERHYSQHTLFY